MRGTVAKKIRKIIYVEKMSGEAARRYRYVSGIWFADELRRAYQAAKKLYSEGRLEL